MPILRTKLIRLVEINEFAIVFIGSSIIDTIGILAIGAAANSIYKASFQSFPGLIFIVFAIFGIFPLTIMGYDLFESHSSAFNYFVCVFV